MYVSAHVIDTDVIISVASELLTILVGGKKSIREIYRVLLDIRLMYNGCFPVNLVKCFMFHHVY